MDIRKLAAIAATGAVTLLCGADWPTKSGDPQRDGWARGEREIVTSKVQDLRLLYKRKLDNRSIGLDSLTSPIILSNLISYRGFKEMLFVAGSSGTVYAIDADLNQLLWETRFDKRSGKPPASATSNCPGGLTASLAIAGGSSPFGGFRAKKKKDEAAAEGSGPGVGPGQGGAAHRPAKTPDHPVASDGLFSTGFGRNGYVFAIGGDGYLRFVRQSDGNDVAVPPVSFLPANSKVSSINVSGTTLYAATLDRCGGRPNALYAIDLGGAGNPVMVFPTNGSGLSGEGGTATGRNGTIYVQVSSGHGNVAGNYRDTVLALNPQNLMVTDYFTPESAQKSPPQLGMTPAVFRWKDKDLLVAAGRDGTVYLLDSASLGGLDHHTPLAKTEPLFDGNKDGATAGFRGDFATWADTDAGTRWVYVAFQGSPVLGVREATEGKGNGGVMAFKLEDRGGKPVLAWQWTSRDMQAPTSPITTNGLVFALSNGQNQSDDASAINGHAVMYALDGTTGKELFSSGNDAGTFSHDSGLALANGRVYFTTHDNTVYCYGFPALQPQLTER